MTHNGWGYRSSVEGGPISTISCQSKNFGKKDATLIAARARSSSDLGREEGGCIILDVLRQALVV